MSKYLRVTFYEPEPEASYNFPKFKKALFEFTAHQNIQTGNFEPREEKVTFPTAFDHKISGSSFNKTIDRFRNITVNFDDNNAATGAQHRVEALLKSIHDACIKAVEQDPKHQPLFYQVSSQDIPKLEDRYYIVSHQKPKVESFSPTDLF